MELITWFIGSELALIVAAGAALALTSVAILRDVRAAHPRPQRAGVGAILP
ncbi:MAG TPA: hypothetical protein VGS01_05230 [Candidatus Limnocylindria bacterium]|nr:hypothetical protein [Candidatus Limnocylindria bacterium]